jgi:hypothetical protein
MFASPSVTIPKEAFLAGVAKTLLPAAAVFGEDRLAARCTLCYADTST